MNNTVESKLPFVSIVMATYNRSDLLGRAVDSVLNQTYKNIDLIIVDDGSTDDTSEFLKKYTDPRIRVFKHEVNRGATAAKNTGLRQVTGEWFTFYDSDDEMVPDAVETLMNIPLHFDPEVTSVTANGWEPISNTFTGKGLDKDCYLNGNEIMLRCTGDFWGIIKTELLHNESFNEKLIGCESTLWYKLGERAKGYYVHKALSIIHVEGNDRITTSKVSFEKKVLHYENIINEELYLKITKQSDPDQYLDICKHGLLITRLNRNSELASRYYELLKSTHKSLMYYCIYKFDFTLTVYKVYAELMPWLRKLRTR